MLTQRGFKYLLHRFYIVKFQSLYKFGIYIFNVFLVLPAQDDLFLPRTFSRENFLFDTTYRQHLAA